jgi:hypothetical protein
MRSLLALAACAAVLLPAVATAQVGPLVAAPPIITGDPVVGSRLTALQTELIDAVPEDLVFDWERSDGPAFVPIPGAHERGYVATAADVGHRLRVRVTVETAAGTDEAWSEPTAPVGYRSGSAVAVRIGPEPGAPVSLSRWRVVAGTAVQVTGRLDPALVSADVRLLLEPTVQTYAVVEAPVAIDAGGGVTGSAVPAVNAVAWLEIVPPGEAPQRIRLGLVGVRPRISVALGARPDGHDASGRALLRDLRLLPGSVLAPALAGLRLTWEGRLPGDRTGTAVCRSTERIISGERGRLHGGCRTRGSWQAARWRLVLDPGTRDPMAAPFLPAASAWVVPRVGAPLPPEVPVLLRSSATLPPWN